MITFARWIIPRKRRRSWRRAHRAIGLDFRDGSHPSDGTEIDVEYIDLLQPEATPA